MRAAAPRLDPADVLAGPALVRLAGAAVRFDPSGALHWPDAGLVVVADLHLEKGSSHARRRRFLPPYDTRATLAALEAVLARLAPRRVIALGDSFHDKAAEDRLAPDDAARLARLVDAHDWIWVAGNHDPAPPARLGGARAEAVEIGGLVFRHEPTLGAADGEVAGHLHPAARVGGAGRVVRRRAFACDGLRCVLPAFGAFTGGLDLTDPAFAGLFAPGRLLAWMIAAGAVHPVPAARLLG